MKGAPGLWSKVSIIPSRAENKKRVKNAILTVERDHGQSRYEVAVGEANFSLFSII